MSSKWYNLAGGLFIAGLVGVIFLASARISGAQVMPQSIWRLSGTNISTIISSWKTGVGSTTPNAKLTVQGTAGSADSIFNVATSTGAPLLTVAPGGTTTIKSLILTENCVGCGGNPWPFTTTDTNYGVSVQSTTTPLWFKGTPYSLFASTTAVFVNATSTLLTSTTAWIDTLNLTNALGVASGGTGQTSFGQGWLHSDGTTLTASTSPTINYLVATSTTATSTFAGNVSVTGDLQVSGKFFGLVQLITSGDATINGALTVTGATTLATTLTGAVSAASGVISAGTLSVANGGTGLSSFTANSLLYSNSAGTALAFAATSTLNIGGNAGTATTLETARTINGTSFNGSANITVTAASSTLLTDNSIFTGTNIFNGTLLTITNASTTNLTASNSLFVNNRNVTGFRYVTFNYATSTAWTGTTTVSVVAPFPGTLQDIQCSSPTGTLNSQMLVGATNVTPMFNASSTVGQVTFTANNTFSAGDILKMSAGTPASSPTELNCTGRATGA